MDRDHRQIQSRTQAWLPRNITFVNKPVFAALDKPTREGVMKAGAPAGRPPYPDAFPASRQ